MTQRIIICSLLIIGLNQSLFVRLVVSRQRNEDMPIPAACACKPENCMCPPNSGCEHKKPPRKENTEISTSRLNACRQRLTFHPAGEREVPILAHRLNNFVPYPLYSRLEFLLTGFASQLHLSPPDKPPQTFIT